LLKQSHQLNKKREIRKDSPVFFWLGGEKLELLAVGGIFKSLTQTLEVTSHANECVAGREKEGGESCETNYQRKSKVHATKVNLAFPADKSLFSGTFQRPVT
jgi:hypothetical protein